jgi:hypothetical protein
MARAWNCCWPIRKEKTSEMFNTTLRKFIAPRCQARKERHLLIFRTLAPPSMPLRTCFAPLREPLLFRSVSQFRISKVLA